MWKNSLRERWNSYRSFFSKKTPIEDTTPHLLLLCLNFSLCNSVAPELRAVTADIDAKKDELYITFFYDGEVTDKLFDLASVAVAEIDIYPPEYQFPGEVAVRLDFPQPIPIRGRLAFLRKEPALPKFKKENRAFLLAYNFRPISVLCLDMQEALLGKVTPELREVLVDVDRKEELLRFYFFYDGPISEENKELAQCAIEEARVTFPTYKVDAHIERVDFPDETDPHECTVVYWRRENKY